MLPQNVVNTSSNDVSAFVVLLVILFIQIFKKIIKRILKDTYLENVLKFERSGGPS